MNFDIRAKAPAKDMRPHRLRIKGADNPPQQSRNAVTQKKRRSSDPTIDICEGQSRRHNHLATAASASGHRGGRRATEVPRAIRQDPAAGANRQEPTARSQPQRLTNMNNAAKYNEKLDERKVKNS